MTNILLSDQNRSKSLLSPKNSKEKITNKKTINSNLIQSKNDSTWNEIILNLKVKQKIIQKNNINEAIILSNRKDTYLIKLIEKISKID